MENMEDIFREVNPPINFYLSYLEEQLSRELKDSETRLTQSRSEGRVHLEIQENSLTDLVEHLQEMKDDKWSCEKELMQRKIYRLKAQLDEAQAKCVYSSETDTENLQYQLTKTRKILRRVKTDLEQQTSDNRDLHIRLEAMQREKEALQNEVEAVKLEVSVEKQLPAVADINLETTTHCLREQLLEKDTAEVEAPSKAEELERHLAFERDQTEKLQKRLHKLKVTCQKQEEDAQQTLERAEASHQAQLKDQEAETDKVTAALRKAEDVMVNEHIRFHSEKTTLLEEMKECRALCFSQIEEYSNENSKLVTALKKAAQQLESDSIKWQEEKSSLLQFNDQLISSLQEKEQECKTTESCVRAQLQEQLSRELKDSEARLTQSRSEGRVHLKIQEDSLTDLVEQLQEQKNDKWSCEKELMQRKIYRLKAQLDEAQAKCVYSSEMDTKNLQYQLRKTRRILRRVQKDLEQQTSNNGDLQLKLEAMQREKEALQNEVEAVKLEVSVEKQLPAVADDKLETTTHCLRVQPFENDTAEVEAPSKTEELERHLAFEWAQTEKLQNRLYQLKATHRKQKEDVKQTLERAEASHQAQLKDQEAKIDKITAALRKAGDLMVTERIRFNCEKTTLLEEMEECRALCFSQLERYSNENSKLVTALKKAAQQLESDSIKWQEEKSSLLQFNDQLISSLQEKEQECKTTESCVRAQLQEQLSRELKDSETRLTQSRSEGRVHLKIQEDSLTDLVEQLQEKKNDKWSCEKELMQRKIYRLKAQLDEAQAKCVYSSETDTENLRYQLRKTRRILRRVQKDLEQKPSNKGDLQFKLEAMQREKEALQNEVEAVKLEQPSMINYKVADSNSPGTGGGRQADSGKSCG